MADHDIDANGVRDQQNISQNAKQHESEWKFVNVTSYGLDEDQAQPYSPLGETQHAEMEIEGGGEPHTSDSRSQNDHKEQKESHVSHEEAQKESLK